MSDRDDRAGTGRGDRHGRQFAGVLGGARRRSVQVLGALVLGVAVVSAWEGAAQAEDSGGPAGAGLAGYDISTEALGAQFTFNIPGFVPVSGNMLEQDLPFARTSVSEGPVVDALAAPWYPGDILANLGTLLTTFGAPPQASQLNDPLLAEAKYPPSPGYPQDASFGGTPPPGMPLAPNVFSGVAHASADSTTATATLSDLAAAPSGASGPVVHVATVQVANAATIGAATVSATASAVLKTIDVAGVLEIAQLEGSARSSSDGSTGTPDASLHLGQVTVDGVPAYIDRQGVHVDQNGTSSSGVTPAEAQQVLDTTFAQDGISVRLLDPQTSTDGSQAGADSGGLVISVTHQAFFPVLPGAPSVPVPGLGNESPPAGTYTVTSTLTLGHATVNVDATALPSTTIDTTPGTTTPGLVALPLGGGELGTGSLGASGGFGALASAQTLPASGPGAAPQPAGPGGGFLGSVAHLPPLGLPAPLGWVVVSLLLCVVLTWPMLLTARWQFLGGRRRA